MSPRRRAAQLAGAAGLLLLASGLPAWGADAATGADPDAETAAIIAAVKKANGLEQAYWRNPRAFPTWEALYAHYRQGYSASIAEQMTEFSREQAGDLATWVPEQVEVAGFDGDSAVAWFRTPEEYGKDGPWGFEPYMVVRLRREDGRWIIYWATDSASPPPAP